jgi:Protein of unknown function (DUF2815).
MSRIKTPPCRASYPKLFEPEVNDKGKKVYGLVLLVEDTEEGRAFLKEAEALADEAGRGRFRNYDELKKSSGFKKAIRYDVDKYKDVTNPHPIIAFINSRSYDTPPGVVSIYAGPDHKPMKITDPQIVYPGAYVRASLHAYAYDQDKSKGVALGLGNVQVMQNMAGERIDSRVAAEDEFEADPKAAANLDDL